MSAPEPEHIREARARLAACKANGCIRCGRWRSAAELLLLQGYRIDRPWA